MRNSFSGFATRCAWLTTTLGTAKGYRIYATDSFYKTSESREGDVSSLEMLFSTSLVALTLSPRILRVHNIKAGSAALENGVLIDTYQRHSTICELTFPTAILAIRLNRKRLIVVLETDLYIYDIGNLDLIKRETTSPNPNGMHHMHFDLSIR